MFCFKHLHEEDMSSVELPVLALALSLLQLAKGHSETRVFLSNW